MTNYNPFWNRPPFNYETVDMDHNYFAYNPYNAFFPTEPPGIKPSSLHAFGDLFTFLDSLPDGIKPSIGDYLMRAAKHYIDCYNQHLSKLRFNGPPPPNMPHFDFNDHQFGSQQQQQLVDQESSIVEITEEDEKKDEERLRRQEEQQVKTESEKMTKVVSDDLIDLSFPSDEEMANIWSANATTSAQSFWGDTPVEKSSEASNDEVSAAAVVTENTKVDSEPSTVDLSSLLDLKCEEMDCELVSNVPAPAPVATDESSVLEPNIVENGPSTSTSERNSAVPPDQSLVDQLVRESYEARDDGIGESENDDEDSDDSMAWQSANDSSPLLTEERVESNLAADLASLLNLKSEMESVQESSEPAPAVVPTVESPVLKPTNAESGVPAVSTSERKSSISSTGIAAVASSKSDSIFSSSEFMSFFSDLKLNPAVATSLAASSSTKSEDKIPETPIPQVPIQTTKNVSIVAPMKPPTPPPEKPLDNQIASGLDPSVLDPKVACILCPALAHCTESCPEYSNAVERIFRAQKLKRCLLCLELDHTKDICPQKDTIRCQNCFLSHSNILYHVNKQQL